MSGSESAADRGLQRLILVDVVDINDQPVSGATVSLFVNSNFAGKATTPNGRATFQIGSTSAEIAVEASYKTETKRLDLASDANVLKIELLVDTSVHVVILIHGINTHAQWLGIVGPALE